MKKLGITLVVLFALTVGLLGIVLGVIFIGSMPGDTRAIQEVAAKFKASSSWQEKHQVVHAPQLACLEANCNTAYYQWIAQSDITKNDLEIVLDTSNFKFDVSGDCNGAKAPSGSGSTVCSAEGVVDGFEVGVDITKSSDKPNVSIINLRIKE